MPSAAYRYRDPLLLKAEHVVVDARHRLWVEQSGIHAGIPVVALHGGPGIPLEPADRRLFDPARFRLFQFDQRGCGRSTPSGELADNSLWHSVDDIELLRQRYGIERWIVTGHSYGATLALAYAQTHPDRCSALVLRGLYLNTPRERDWIVNGWRMMRPDAWAEAVRAIAPDEGEDYYAALRRRLTSADPAERDAAAIAYSRYELECCYADPDPAVIEPQLDVATCRVNAAIAGLYDDHDTFLTEGQLIAGIDRIRHIPATVVSGTADIVTPPYSAWLLKQSWPELDVRRAPRAGHASTEPGNIAAMTDVMDALADRLMR